MQNALIRVSLALWDLFLALLNNCIIKPFSPKPKIYLNCEKHPKQNVAYIKQNSENVINERREN